MDLMIEDLMEQLVEGGGSDLHIATGQPPYGRFSGELRPMRDEALAEEDCNKLIFSMLNNSQRKTLEQTWELDCAYGLKGVARFRVNVYRQKGSYAACLRALGSKIPSVELLNLPPVVLETSKRPRGLVLVTGPTGSGKTTTLAALLDHINHTRSFANALRAALREDPDVILVGEMRDLETIQLAVSAAETGHLVFGTLHTSSAAHTVDRMVDVFPPEQQTQIRVQLSGSLVAVFSQTLCKRHDPKPGQFGRVMAQEILINTSATANLIREGKTAQLYSQIQTGGEQGMQTLEKALADLVNSGDVSRREAMAKASKPGELERLIRDE